MGSRSFQIYVVPAAVFQSVMIGGGYGTGREIVEYFTRFGLLGGLLGIAVAALALAAVLGMTFDYARRHAAYDYRRFMRSLTGPGWVAFEILYLLLMMIVLAVVGAAASRMLFESFGIPPLLGALSMLAIVALLTLVGRTLVERSLTTWAILLSLIFVAYFVLAATRLAAPTSVSLGDGVTPGWLPSGLTYVLYNVAIAPGLLFAVRAIGTRREAYASAGIAAVAAMVPAALFHLTFVPQLPAIAEVQLPTYATLATIDAGWFVLLYALGLVGTLVQTGVGIIQGFIERIDAWRVESQRAPLRAAARASIATVAVALSAGLSSLGIIALIGKGYGLLAWGFLIVYVLPLAYATLFRGARS